LEPIGRREYIGSVKSHNSLWLNIMITSYMNASFMRINIMMTPWRSSLL